MPRLYGSIRSSGFKGSPADSRRSSGQVTMRTSVNPRSRAVSARFRASTECPQMTGSALTMMMSLVGLVMISPFDVGGKCSGGDGSDGGRAIKCAPPAGFGAEFYAQVSAVVHLVAAQPRAGQWCAVELDRLHVLRRPAAAGLHEAARLDGDRVATGHPDARLGERGGPDEEQVLTRDREQAERRPDVPGAQPA